MKENNQLHAAANSFVVKASCVSRGAFLDVVKNRTMSAPGGNRTQNPGRPSRSRVI